MITIKGNILDVKQGFICHQVNCKGVMGAGLAADIRSMWPKVFNDYMAAHTRRDLALGEVVFTTIKTSSLYIASLCGQFDFGHIKRYTDYPSLGRCFRKIKDWYKVVGDYKLPVYIPFNMGCGLAGGDWSTVEGIIRRELPEAIIVKL